MQKTFQPEFVPHRTQENTRLSQTSPPAQTLNLLLPLGHSQFILIYIHQYVGRVQLVLKPWHNSVKKSMN